MPDFAEEAKLPPTASVRTTLAGQLGYGWFEPSSMPQVDYTPIVKNWESAGVWTESEPGRYRLTTIRHATMICYLESGRIVESGTHDALVARDGCYRALLALAGLPLGRRERN